MTQDQRATITGVRRASDADWDAHWRSSPHATYFQNRHWSEVWLAYSGAKYTPDPIHVTFHDGLSAVIPVTRQRMMKGLTSVAHLSPGGTFGGWVSKDALRSDHGNALSHYIVSLNNSFVWRLNPYDPLIAAQSIEGMRDDTTQVAILNVPFDEFFRNWSKGHKAAVKQAERSGVTVRTASGLADWQSYFTVYEDSVRRWGENVTSEYSWELFEALALREHNGITLWLAELQGDIVAGAVCLYAPKHVTYWHGAALESSFESRPVHLLLYQAMRDAHVRGYRWFDFNPSGSLDSVRAFKKSFGTTCIPCPVIKRDSLLLHQHRTLTSIRRSVKRPIFNIRLRFAGSRAGRRSSTRVNSGSSTAEG